MFKMRIKKLIALGLATAMAVSAADEATKPVKVTFIYDKADIKGIPVPETKELFVECDKDDKMAVYDGKSKK